LGRGSKSTNHKEQLGERMKNYSTTITPRFYETDALGHINNASIAAWFEVARVNFLESLGESDPSAAKDWILASIKIDFAAETFYGTDVIANITEAKIGNSSLTVVCEMMQGEKMTVRGTATLVHIDAQSKKPARVPDELREELAAR
jgi:acyl-CoA thioester hydrolase